MTEDGDPCERRGCAGRVSFSRRCGAYVCLKCGHHHGMNSCSCGWHEKDFVPDHEVPVREGW
jgi:hypothetical protein